VNEAEAVAKDITRRSLEDAMSGAEEAKKTRDRAIRQASLVYGTKEVSEMIGLTQRRVQEINRNIALEDKIGQEEGASQ